LFGSHVAIYPDKIPSSIHPDKIRMVFLVIRHVTVRDKLAWLAAYV